jgi:hypothetical protein
MVWLLLGILVEMSREGTQMEYIIFAPGKRRPIFGNAYIHVIPKTRVGNCVSGLKWKAFGGRAGLQAGVSLDR